MLFVLHLSLHAAPLTPSDADNLRFLLRPICFKWEELAKALLVDEDLIDEVNISNKTDEACLQEVIDGYFDNSNFEHDWEEIVTILREINEEQLADKICDLHVYRKIRLFTLHRLKTNTSIRRVQFLN